MRAIKPKCLDATSSHVGVHVMILQTVTQNFKLCTQIAGRIVLKYVTSCFSLFHLLQFYFSFFLLVFLHHLSSPRLLPISLLSSSTEFERLKFPEDISVFVSRHCCRLSQFRVSKHGSLGRTVISNAQGYNTDNKGFCESVQTLYSHSIRFCCLCVSCNGPIPALFALQAKIFR
jgi:hypothetical protein